MKKKMNRRAPEWLLFTGVGLLTMLLTVLHYSTPYEAPVMHAIYRFLYYIPVIFAAFFWGKRGGLLLALIISILYLPHILFSWGQIALHSTIAAFEILLYFVTGLLTGGIVDRWKKEVREKEKLLAAFRETDKLSALGEMSHVIIHELKTPLASIEGAISILCKELTFPPHLSEFKDILQKETKRVHRMLDETLKQLSSGKMKAKTIDINIFLHEVGEIADFIRPLTNTNFQILYPKDSYSIRLDPDLMKQALINLIKNAFEALENSNNGKITLRVTNTNQAVVFIIEDNGPGISEERVNKIFKAFYTHGKQGGMGLGLAVTRRIVDMHHGSLRYENMTPHGSRFTMTLPGEDAQ